MQTIALHVRPEQASHHKESLQEKGRWTSRIRVERRRGRTFYSITFSNGGRTVASLRGGFTPLPIVASVMQAEAISAATGWLTHVKVSRSNPNVRSINRSWRRRRHHQAGRRAA